MRFLAAVVAALATVAAVSTWPDATDELEDITFLLTGHSSRGFSSAVTPCSFSSAGLGRQSAAEWLWTTFHDMATGNVFLHTGGLDASLMFELNSGENIGVAFNTFMSGLFNSRVSVADLIALGVYMAVRSCSGPAVQIRAGRIDATAAGPLGVPLAQNSIGTFQN
jgi:Peroxidase